MTARRTKTTALLPAYQAGEFIQATLDSLSAQAGDNFGVIISVDVCDDDTHDICLRHAGRDRRFQVFRQSQRLGYVGNCNFLLDQADSDYVFFAFHDDLLAPDYAAKLAAALDAHPEAVMSYSDLLLTAVDGSQEHCAYTALDGLHDPVLRGELILARKGPWWVPNRGLFRLDRARAIGGLKTHGAGEFSADWPWLFHMSLLGGFVRVPETLCFKYYKAGSLSRGWEFSKRQHYEAAAACMREIWNSALEVDAKRTLAESLEQKMARIRRRIAPAQAGLLQRLLGAGSRP